MRILVAEDEPVVANLIKKTLEEESYEVTLAPDGQTAWDYISRFTYDAVVLDIMMPVLNGLEICRRTRKAGNQVPILLLTALGTTDNIVVGLDSGADDYLTKPFKVAELTARLRSLLRRKQTGLRPDETPKKNKLSFSDLVMDLDGKQVMRNGNTIDLTVTEFRLLEYFLRNTRRVLSRMDILENVWGYDFNMNTKVVDVYINYLRKKLDSNTQAKLIHTVTGMGYVLKD